MDNDFFKIYELLSKFETQKHISFFDSKYGNLWPLFKIEIYKSFLTQYKKIEYKNIFWRTGGSVRRVLISYFKNNSSVSKLIYEGKDELWLSSIGRRVNGYNKFTDPFYNEMASSNALMIEKNSNKSLIYQNEHLIKNNSVFNYESSYNTYSVLFFHKNILSYSKVVKKLKLEEIYKEFPQSHIFNLFITYSYFVHWYNFYIHFFSKFPSLKRIYYTGNGTPDTFALNAAAHALNIETIEFQHGVISKNGIDYKYKVLNDNLLKLAPSKIYVYSSEAKEILENNTNGRIKIEQIENFAFTKWKNTQGELENKNSILLTLQNIVFPQDHFLFSFFKYINEKFPEFKIVIRLHPSHRYLKTEFEELLDRLKISFEWDNKAGIYDSLSNAILNITAFSTTVEDAIQMKVPSWLISHEGGKLYEQHINTNPLVKSILTIEDAILAFETTYKKRIN